MAHSDDTPYDEMLSYILPEWRTRFEIASEDYGDAFRDLGLRGQYSDMHRKFKKIKRVFWDGGILRREQPEEILFDIIGHCLISIWLLRNTNEGMQVTGGRVVEAAERAIAVAVAQEDIKAGDNIEFDLSTGKAQVHRG